MDRTITLRRRLIPFCLLAASLGCSTTMVRVADFPSAVQSDNSSDTRAIASAKARPPMAVPSEPILLAEAGGETIAQDVSRAASVDAEADGGPDISDPGPDTADLPDSAFAVPPGVTYVETSLSYLSSKGPRVRDYFTGTLIRTGLWKDFELRIATPGVIHQHAPDESITGFGPLTFGFKQHVWSEVEECSIPAFGIIAQVTAPTASAGFDDGTAIPTVFFNFDYSLPRDSYFEVNFGISGLHADDGDRFVQGSFLWSLGKEWSDNFTTFFHGFFNAPSGTGDDEELLMGPGMIWFVSKQVAIDSSYNFGVTDATDHRFIRIGLSVAF